MAPIRHMMFFQTCVMVPEYEMPQAVGHQIEKTACQLQLWSSRWTISSELQKGVIGSLTIL